MTRNEKYEELTKIVKNEEEAIERQIIAILSLHISNKIKIDITRYNCRKELTGHIYVVDDENETIFGANVDFTINERTTGLEVNYGSIGSHNSTERKAAYKDKDILIGKIWEYEHEIIQIYNNIKWNNLRELEQICDEVYKEEIAKRNADLEEKRRQEMLQLEIILDYLCPGRKITDLTNEWTEFKIDKVGRKNILLDRKLWINGKFSNYIEKISISKIYKRK